MNPIWNSFIENWPMCEWIWLYHPDEGVDLRRENSLVSASENCLWAEAKIDYPDPPVPVKKRHRCSNIEVAPLFDCWESEQGILYLDSFSQMGSKCSCPIKFCPYCGYEAKK